MWYFEQINIYLNYPTILHRKHLYIFFNYLTRYIVRRFNTLICILIIQPLTLSRTQYFFLY